MWRSPFADSAGWRAERRRVAPQARAAIRPVLKRSGEMLGRKRLTHKFYRIPVIVYVNVRRGRETAQISESARFISISHEVRRAGDMIEHYEANSDLDDRGTVERFCKQGRGAPP
jgi:hypothetical protein